MLWFWDIKGSDRIIGIVINDRTKDVSPAKPLKRHA